VHRLATCLAALACLLAAGGCGGESGADDGARDAPSIPAGVAGDLAERSDAIAATLEAGDVCGAAQQADELKAAVAEAVAAGRVPAAFRAELEATAEELVNEINCPPPAEEEEEQQGEGGGDCEALAEQKQALEDEKDDAQGKGRERQLEEQIKQIDEQLKECERGEGGDDGEDDD
jgi:hypothetical protein